MTLRRPRLMILGYARHGKDTAADILFEKYGYRHTASSWFMVEKVVYPAFKAVEGQPLPGAEGAHRMMRQEPQTYPVYPSADACWKDRANWRSFWFDQIAAYNKPNRAALTKAIFADGNDIYSGCRNAAEVHAGRLQKAFDLAVWIDASERHPPEDRSSCTIEPWMADLVIDNNGTLRDLEGNLEHLWVHHLHELERGA